MDLYWFSRQLNSGKSYQRRWLYAGRPPHLTSLRAHYGVTCSYIAIPVPGAGETPEQGSVFTIGGSCFLPTSRGSVKISSTNALDHPIIDPNCLGTDHDRCIMRSAIRFDMKVMNTNAAKEKWASKSSHQDFCWNR